MTTNTDPVRALIGEMTEYLDQQVDPELDVIAKWRDRLESSLASAPTAEAQAQGGGEVAWRVPVLQSPFGEQLDHGVRDELVLVMHRGAHGWKAAGHALLAHQLYVKNVRPLCAASHEVAVVGLSGGGWRTVWARSDDDVTHPAPPSATVGVDGAPTWSRQQPTVPGIYGIRGFNLCRPASEQFEAVVVVREHGGELVCNLHESTSEDDLESWAPICDLDPDFEWRVFVPGWQQQGGRADG